MRAVFVAAMVLASLAAASVSGSAQSQAEPFLKDAEGDTEFRAVVQDSPAKVPFTGGEAATVDILAFDLVESDSTLDFVLQLKSLKQTAGFTTYEMHFTWGKTEYVVGVRVTNVPGVTQNRFAYLASDEDGWDWRAELEPQMDLEKGILRVSLEKAYILDGRDDVPSKGDVLKDVYAESSLAMVFFAGFFGEVVDRAPDGEDVKAFTFQVGNFHSGSLRAEAEQPVRVSNGDSTTFVYRVQLANVGDAAHEVEVRPESLPEGWNVTVQSPVRLGAQDGRTVAVLASVPFGHEHGGFDSFTVNFTSRTDPASAATVRLGVLHTPIPQPAGHHSDLFLHVEKPSGVRWGGWGTTSMNTGSTHDQDAAEATPTASTGDEVTWWIPLNPRLGMGLDFDLERLGSLVGSVIGRSTAEGTVTAELLYGPRGATPWDEGDLVPLAESDAQKVSLDLTAAKPFSLVLTPTEDADYLPFEPEANLFLKVVLSTDTLIVCCPQDATPTLRTADFKLTLPLNEYHDKLTGVAEASAVVDLVADGPVEKLGRPGTVLTYAFTLKNAGAAPVVVDLDLAGTDAAAGALVPDGPVELGAGQSRKVTLAVTIPPQAQAGQEMEVLLFAHAQDDPGKSAIARTKTTVTLGGEATADETDLLVAARAEENKDTPGLALPATLLAALGAALLLAARRRRG